MHVVKITIYQSDNRGILSQLIGDFRLTVHIGNIMGNHVISLIFSCHCIGSSICSYAHAFWLCYSLFFY